MAQVHGHGAGVAGGAFDLDQKALAAVDRRDHAQRQVLVQQLRTLFDVDFEIAQHRFRVACQRGNRLRIESGAEQRFAQADAVRVEPVEQAQVELAGDRAAAEIGGAEAHAFFVTKADDFQVEIQFHAAVAQLLDHGDRQQDAETAVVGTAVDHGVVVRTHQQRLCVRAAAGPAADDVADGVDLRLHSGRAHPVAKPLRGRAMGRAEIGAAQRVRVVGVLTQMIGHGEDAVAHRFAQALGEAEFGDAFDLCQRGGPLGFGVVVQALLEGPQHRASVMALDREYERKAEARVVGRVERLQTFEFLGAAFGQAGSGLLSRGFGREFAAHRGLAGEFRMRAHQRQLLVRRRGQHHRLHRRQ